jgi:hypothetical protein
VRQPLGVHSAYRASAPSTGGPIGAAMAMWPAVAPVGSYERLMIIRGTQQPAGYVRPRTEITLARAAPLRAGCPGSNVP